MLTRRGHAARAFLRAVARSLRSAAARVGQAPGRSPAQDAWQGLGARSYSPDGDAPPPAPEGGSDSPTPELAERPRRRRFTAEYKQRVLRAAEACTRTGEIGAMLRREGLYIDRAA